MWILQRSKGSQLVRCIHPLNIIFQVKSNTPAYERLCSPDFAHPKSSGYISGRKKQRTAHIPHHLESTTLTPGSLKNYRCPFSLKFGFRHLPHNALASFCLFRTDESRAILVETSSFKTKLVLVLIWLHSESKHVHFSHLQRMKKGDHRPRNSAKYEWAVELLIMHEVKWTPRQIWKFVSVSILPCALFFTFMNCNPVNSLTLNGEVDFKFQGDIDVTDKKSPSDMSRDCCQGNGQSERELKGLWNPDQSRPGGMWFLDHNPLCHNWCG